MEEEVSKVTPTEDPTGESSNHIDFNQDLRVVLDNNESDCHSSDDDTDSDSESKGGSDSEDNDSDDTMTITYLLT